MRFETTRVAPCNIFSPCDDINNGGTGGGGGNVNPNCADPNYRATHPSECPDDPRCSDPNFAAANPTLCLNVPRLIVKPSAAVVEVLDEVQYKAYLVINGEETLLDDGVTWASGDAAIALIGARSGNAIGVAVGITSVYATYGALTAAAQIEVIADGACSTRANHFLLLFDVSESSGGAFGGAFATRLAMAKDVAENLIDTANLGRDEYAVMKFDAAATEVQAFSQDADVLTDAIMSIAQTQNRTNIAAALADARDYFDDEGVEDDGRVVVLFTDGENNEGSDPLPVAEAIRDSGIILIIVGLRAKGVPYRMLERMASGGFFVNALPSNADSVGEWVSGMRQYLCSGNCVPEGGVTVGVGQLNYTGFANWDVIASYVDLIGKNEGGPPLYDFLPGNGLYVDLAGSTSGVANLGVMRTKSAFTLTSGKTFRLICRLAANQREMITDVNAPDEVHFALVDGSGNVIAEHTVSFTNHTDDFDDFSFDYTGTGESAKIVVEQSWIGHPTGVFGNLLDRVTLRNITDDQTIFDDNFDGENEQFIDPACGYAEDERTGDSGYGYDYCYNTCLDAPIPGQVPDPSPLPYLEDESEPVIYTSTQSATACCDDDLDNCATRVATAESDISQADADARAYAAALALAEAALDCGDTGTLAVGRLINFQFAVIGVDAPRKVGPAVLGNNSTDWWNGFPKPATLLDSTQVDTGVELIQLVGSASQPQLHPDPIMRTAWYGYTLGSPASETWVLTGLPAGTYTLVMYAHGPANGDNASVKGQVGTYNSGTGVFTPATTYGPETTANGSGWQSATWTEGQQYVRFDNVVVTAGQAVAFKIESQASAYAWYNAFQIKRTA